MRETETSESRNINVCTGMGGIYVLAVGLSDTRNSLNRIEQDGKIASCKIHAPKCFMLLNRSNRVGESLFGKIYVIHIYSCCCPRNVLLVVVYGNNAPHMQIVELEIT